MTRCICHVDPAAVPAGPPDGELHVLLYGGRPARDGTAAIGAGLRDLYRSFGVQPSAAAVDLVSIALAVTAADTYVPRRKTAAPGGGSVREAPEKGMADGAALRRRARPRIEGACPGPRSGGAGG